MHEASLMRGLMAKVEAIARENGAERVTGITVRLGALCHISPSHFEEHFRSSSAGTIADGARIEAIEETDIADSTAQDVVLVSLDVDE